FFQAEDGIRDLTVTGVQTCALPISGQIKTGSASRPGLDLPRAAADGEIGDESILSLARPVRDDRQVPRRAGHVDRFQRLTQRPRSEERRVGKECRTRWPAERMKKT